jgi:glycosyltransferase involved in cell wall biosynthesis
MLNEGTIVSNQQQIPSRKRFLFAAQGFPGVVGTSSGSGIGTYVRELTLGLTARGHECHVLVWSDTGPREEAFVDGIRVHFACKQHWPLFERWWPDSRNVWNRAKKIKKLHERHLFDWIEIESDEGIDIGTQSRFRDRVILRVHTTLAQMCREKNVPAVGRTAHYLSRERASFRLARKVIANSIFHATELSRTHPELPVPEVIPHGWGRAESEPLIESYQGIPIFLYVGSLDRRKGVDRFRPILAQYASRYGQCELRIVTSSPDAAFYDLALDKIDPQVKVSLRRGLSEVELNAEYRSAASVLHPARFESFGLPLIEAASFGTPVVTSAIGIAPELCFGPLARFLVDMENPSSVAEAMWLAIETRTESGKAFYAAYSKNFTRDSMTDRYIRLITKWSLNRT